jgi:hypothetical protein
VITPSTGDLETAFSYTSITTGGSRGVAVDAAGNVLTSNAADEHVRMWSPPGASSYTSNQPGHFALNPTLTLDPSGTVTLSKGQTKIFNATGGVAPYTWSLSTDNVGSINTTAGATVTFNADSAGTVDLTVTDSRVGAPQSIIASITVNPTSAPLFKEAEPRRYIRFELFE